MRIAYCEDESAQARYICAMIAQWADSRGTTAEVVLYESAEEFLFKNEEYPYHAVLLDIAMKQMNGVDLAHKIRQKDKHLPIAFLTADKDFALEGYEVQAVRYLIKPIVQEKLYELLDTLFAELENAVEKPLCIMVEEKGSLRKINEDTICYIEVLGHYTQLYLVDTTVIRVKESFGAILARLHKKEHFVKCHRSYAVNLTYIDKISRTECFLSNKMILPVSRSSYQELNQRFIQHYIKP